MKKIVRQGDLVRIWQLGDRNDQEAREDHIQVGIGVVLKTASDSCHIFLQKHVSIFKKRYWRFEKI